MLCPKIDKTVHRLPERKVAMCNIQTEIDRITNLFARLQDVDLETDDGVREVGFANLQEYELITNLHELFDRFLMLTFNPNDFPEPTERNQRIQIIQRDFIRIHVMHRLELNDDQAN